jgi:hypothetical protein
MGSTRITSGLGLIALMFDDQKVLYHICQIVLPHSVGFTQEVRVLV